MHKTTRVAATAMATTLAFSPCAHAQTADGPPVPYEDVGACPFEGCTYRQWQANASVAIHADRRDDSPVVFQVAKGEKVQALTGVVVTIKAGRAQFDKPQQLASSAGPIAILPGQTLFLLTYQGEGQTSAWFNGRFYSSVDASSVFNAACDSRPERCPGKIIERPARQWWVQVRNAAGQAGWTRETGKFDGKDQLGAALPDGAPHRVGSNQRAPGPSPRS